MTVKLVTPIRLERSIAKTAWDTKQPPIGNDIWGIKWSRDRWRHVTPKLMWGSTVGYPSDTLASCYYYYRRILLRKKSQGKQAQEDTTKKAGAREAAAAPVTGEVDEVYDQYAQRTVIFQGTIDPKCAR